jgi:hypothetical protein
MDSHTLKACLIRINELTGGEHLVGVYSSERLPRNCKRPFAIIAHSEISSVSVGHWLAIYAGEKGPVYFFDSYGFKPYVDNHISFLKRLGSKIVYNEIGYQATDAVTCGGYTLLFLASKMGYIKKFKRFLSKNRERNDKFVKLATVALVENLGVVVK